MTSYDEISSNTRNFSPSAVLPLEKSITRFIHKPIDMHDIIHIVAPTHNRALFP